MSLINMAKKVDSKNLLQRSGLEKVMRGEDAMQQYTKELMAFTNKVVRNADNFKKFQQAVYKFTEAEGMYKDIAKFKDFASKYVQTKGGRTTISPQLRKKYTYNIFQDDGLKNIKYKLPVDVQRLDQLYVFTYTNEMIQRYNKYIIESKKAALKSGVNINVNIATLSSIEGLTSLFDDYSSYDSRYEYTKMRSTPEYWTKPEFSPETRKLHKFIVSKNKVRGSVFNNRSLEALSNLFYALNKSGWTEVIPLAKQLVKLGRYDDIWDALKAANAEVVWKYKNHEDIDDSRAGARERFYEALKQQLGPDALQVVGLSEYIKK